MYNNIIIIPYRDRKKHLEYFIENTIPLIDKHLPNTLVLVVEQNKGKLFNRGALLNIGFKEYEKTTKYFFTHDVDLNPTEKFINEYYSKEVDNSSILGLYTSGWNTLGGIIKVQDDVIQKINGFPNDVWGWGTEDKALQNRSEFYQIKKITCLLDNKSHPQYILRFDDINDKDSCNLSKNTAKHYHHFKNMNNEEKVKEIMSSGLSNLEYKVIDRRKLHDIVECIKVDI